MNKTLVYCENEGCKNRVREDVIGHICCKESISMDCMGGCYDFVPIHTCADCAKFKTRECEFPPAEADDPVCIEFFAEKKEEVK